MTLRRWGDVHAGGESYARVGEGVTLEKYFLSYSGFKSRPSFSITLYKLISAIYIESTHLYNNNNNFIQNPNCLNILRNKYLNLRLRSGFWNSYIIKYEIKVKVKVSSS